uniref:Arrestin C-terminal-like domain-containing protein n=1 Tax=Panagrolaimus davidi TaxID=227884 RepID=A0A914QAX5_9BILA
MSLPKPGYVCGETIPLQIDINSKASMKTESMEYGIKLKCFYTGNVEPVFLLRSAETKTKEECLSVVANSVVPTLDSAIYNILIPPLSPSFVDCSFLKLQYNIFVKVHTDAIFESGPSALIPIIIGTIPFKEEVAAAANTVSATKDLGTANFIEGRIRCKINNEKRQGPYNFRPKFPYYSVNF